MIIEYKKGDLVRRINGNNGTYGAKIGQVATVLSVGSGAYRGLLDVDYPGRDKRYYRSSEGWYVENTELVQPVFKVGDKVAYRPTPDVLAGEVIAVFPNAHSRQQLAVMLAREDKAVRLRSIDGTLYDRSSDEDYVPYVEPPKIEKVTRYVRPIAYGQVRDMLTFNTRSAAEQYVPVLPTDYKYALGEIKEIVLEVEVPSGK